MFHGRQPGRQAHYVELLRYILREYSARFSLGPMNRSIIIAAFIISAASVTPGASPDHTIAVLPFENLSEEKATANFAEGIRGAIVARLTKQHVKAASVQEAPHTGKLLVGSVAKVGDRVRVTVHLVDAASRVPYWSEVYDRELTDVFALQTEIAESVAKMFSAKKP